MCNADLSLWNNSTSSADQELNITAIIANGSLDDFFAGKNWREIIYAIKVIFGIEGAKNV